MDLAPPTPTLSAQTIDGEHVELKMSFNHLNLISQGFSTIDSASLASNSPESRNDILAVLFGKKVSGKFKRADVEDIELSPDEAGKIVDWAVEHLTYFFLGRLAKTRDQLAKIIPEIAKMKDPTSSNPGSEN